ncbi:MAG: MarR family transcriptional regulator [Myxococcota bacterium]
MTGSNAILSINDSVAYHIHRSARLLRAHLLRRIRELGYEATPEQWFVLNKLHQREGRIQSELSDEIFSDRPNITRILDGMERHGWITRKSDGRDGRRKQVFLTRAGRRVAQEIADMARVERAVIFNGLSDEDMAATRRLLEKLESNLRRVMEP